MNSRELNKKGISPVVASVLLIVIVIVIALIVFLWLKGMTEEAITKFDGTNVKLVCQNVKFDASYSGGNIYISNKGNVPIYKMKARISSDKTGAYSTVYLADNWPKFGLTQGQDYSGILKTQSGNKILIIPVLLGKTNKGDKIHTCGDQQGVEVDV